MTLSASLTVMVMQIVDRRAYFVQTFSSVRRWLQLQFDSDPTAIRPRYDHSTTYFTIVVLSVCGLLH